MPNFTGMLRAPVFDFEVTLSRKPTLNACQNARKRIAYVKAHNEKEAGKAAQSQPQHAAYRVSSVRKI